MDYGIECPCCGKLLINGLHPIPDIDSEWQRAQHERAEPILNLSEPDRRFLAALKIGL